MTIIIPKTETLNKNYVDIYIELFIGYTNMSKIKTYWSVNEYHSVLGYVNI